MLRHSLGSSKGVKGWLIPKIVLGLVDSKVVSDSDFEDFGASQERLNGAAQSRGDVEDDLQHTPKHQQRSCWQDYCGEWASSGSAERSKELEVVYGTPVGDEVCLATWSFCAGLEQQRRASTHKCLYLEKECGLRTIDVE